MANSKIMFCGCTTDSRGSNRGAKFQDTTYGNGMRVHAYAPKGNSGSAGWRCGVCSRVKKAEERTA